MHRAPVAVRLLAAEQRHQRVEHDGHARRRRARRQDHVGIRGDRAGRGASPPAAFGERPVEVDEAVAARLVSRAHRVVRVDADRLRAARHGAPCVDVEVVPGDGIARDDPVHAVPGLELADVEAAITGHGARHVEHEGPALQREVPVGRRQLRVEARPEEVDGRLHQVIVRGVHAVGQRPEDG